MLKKYTNKEAAEGAIQSIGLGYDFTNDLSLKYCKKERLIHLNMDKLHHLEIPGVGEVRNVPESISCDKGETMRFTSKVLSFQQMMEQFNKEFSLSGKIPSHPGKIPSGHFNSAFEFTGVWHKDAAKTKTLAFDGVFITLYNIALENSQLFVTDYIKHDVPSSWDPAALARFIQKYGTHVIVGVKMGGKDVIYVKQQHSSPLQPLDVQNKLKDMVDKTFTDGAGDYFEMDKLQDITFMCRRKGGCWNLIKHLTHKKWCQSVQLEPDVISMSLIPITSLLHGIRGSGFLSHAINLYLRYGPPIEELHQFLEFQLPRLWAPVFRVSPQNKQQSTASIQFGIMGPKLYVNTTPVNVGKLPVTGLRLYLEGNRSNCLAIHMQHLSSLPKTFQLEDEPINNVSQRTIDRRYYEKIQGRGYSHVCIAPVESDEDLSIVTGAHFEVEDSGPKKILILRLHFSKVIDSMTVKHPEWDAPPGLAQKSGLISSLISTQFSSGQKPSPRRSGVNINSGLNPGGPPLPTQTPKLASFVDTTEMTRGPQDSPGYWVVSGARLVVEKGKISLRVKYSLITVIEPDEEVAAEW